MWIGFQSKRWAGRQRAYLIKKASFLSLPAFISSRIQRGVAPRPAQVTFGSFLLRYFAATRRPFSDEPRGRPRFAPFPAAPLSFESCFCRSAARSLSALATLSRSSTRASSDMLVRLFERAIWFSFRIGATVYY